MLLGFLAFTCVCHAKPKLVPSLDAELVGTDSVVYCPTIQIAWDGMKQIVGGPIELPGRDSQPIVNQLNQGGIRFSTSSIRLSRSSSMTLQTIR